ncbi:uncharacterized protein with von Willebrand factor type A (vWA) domain [Rhizobium sp. BK212]|uniref:hypothetical protein n=1 Tax=Rhizobium sp. BK212 TaxID=2587074 RepID=UPI0016170C55|nr:hypothetical protein [Rhizobium sp. BK212]MBB4215571.1 uncharacterized protein with von Willebrand factor type A (vWA) domain [Rhizobium sp. BK212]
MPVYAVELKRPIEQAGHLAIADERSLIDLAATLHGAGFIETTDVTAYSGRAKRERRMVLFLCDVSRIYADD